MSLCCEFSSFSRSLHPILLLLFLTLLQLPRKRARLLLQQAATDRDPVPDATAGQRGLAEGFEHTME